MLYFGYALDCEDFDEKFPDVESGPGQIELHTGYSVSPYIPTSAVWGISMGHTSSLFNPVRFDVIKDLIDGYAFNGFPLPVELTEYLIDPEQKTPEFYICELSDD